MGIVLFMSDAKSKRGAPPSGSGSKRKGVVAHPDTKMRDLENMLRYMKRRDERRGID